LPCPGGPNKSAAVGPGQPTVSVTPGLLTGDSLTMHDSVYDGVAQLHTATGTVPALKFSMSKATTTPFRLKIAEREDKSTVITSTELTIEGGVEFYTTKFQGNLVLIPGLPGIPVTFTPERPPPLTLPTMTFTDVRIELAFVKCRTLTAAAMRIAGQ
jgi:hypothetical protein